MASTTLTVKLRQIQKADGINLIHVAMVCINWLFVFDDRRPPIDEWKHNTRCKENTILI